MRTVIWIGIAVYALSIGGCTSAEFASIFRSKTFEPGTTAISADAKQRFLVAQVNPTTAKDPSGAETEAAISRFCAEPSPDALSALSASLSASGSIPEKVAVEIAGSLSEQSSNIGLRTQSIQLLRDAMYRACEGFLNGSIQSSDFMLLQQKYQNIMVGLLAIEQLTGAIRPAQVVLASDASSDTGANLIALQENLDKARQLEADAEQTLNAAQEEAAKADEAAISKRKAAEKAKAEGLPTAAQLDAEAQAFESEAKAKGAERDQARAAYEESQANRRALEEKRDLARSVSSRSGGSGQIVKQPQTPDPTVIAAVAQSVSGIVTAVIEKEFTLDVCLSMISRAASQSRSTTQSGMRSDVINSSSDDSWRALNAGLEFCEYFLQNKTESMIIQSKRTKQKQ